MSSPQPVHYPGIEVYGAPDEENISAECIVGWIEAVLARESCPAATSLACVITNDVEIQDLNRQYRSVDEPTDVLAFSATEGSAFIMPEGEPPYLGDIIISLPAARRQASEAGHSTAEELALLAIHGCLHLLGYDHADEAERSRMWHVQDQILAAL